MDSKTLLLAVTVLAIVFYHQVEAENESRRQTRDSENDINDKRSVLDQLLKKINNNKKAKTNEESEFYYNYVFPKEPEELKARGLKCVPGRTVIRIIEKEPEPDNEPNSSDEDNRRVYKRSHMNFDQKEEYCKVCVCSVEGKDEYCSGRPASNVNECLRLTLIDEEFNQNNAYDHTRGLPFRIRRDYIWHNDEIPYEPKAKCRRGHSYYTNNENANDTDIDISSDIESLLDYSNPDKCLYCVCSTHGQSVDCIKRDLWFCHYFRYLRRKDSSRDMYSRLLQQDRPTYFRQFSWRLRRTMDDSINDLVETVGLNAEHRKCLPFVSEYTDCNDENMCTGCKKCICVGEGKWACDIVKECTDVDNDAFMDEESIDDALGNIERGLIDEIKREKVNPKSPLVPAPRNKHEDPLLDDEDLLDPENIDRQFLKILLRKRRSLGNESNKTNDKIKFYHTVDEINEDIFKNDNSSGTIEAKKFQNAPKASRRVGVLDNNSLLIELTDTKIYEPHISENKIDVTGHSDKYVKQDNEQINALIANHTVKQKDKELSKLIVNELKNGSEVIGDKDAPVMSNITFTSENDTLTAMAFIAGNLLNQLWNMEKESSEESLDTQDLKQEKIADLLDLFKEPLNMRQENFLKNALEHLSVAIDKDKILKNVSLCEKIEESRRLTEVQKESIEDVTDETIIVKREHTEIAGLKEEEAPKIDAASKAISKIGDVLNLIKKFEQVHKTLNDLKKTDKQNMKPRVEVSVKKRSKTKTTLTNDETVSLNVFGNILEKITKLLMPNKKGKKVVKAIKRHHLYAKSNGVAQTIKDKYGIDIGNTTLSAKDRMVLDYLNTVKSHPNCIFHNIQDEPKSFANVEGDILLNLSDFLKIKSFLDLLKLLNSEKEDVRSNETSTRLPDTNTNTNYAPEMQSPQKVTTPTTSTSKVATTTTRSNKLAETKERLKYHIKSIIEDLRELQIAKGSPVRNISLADTLPCIYNLLNAGKETPDNLHKNKEKSPAEKISSIFGSLKRDLLAAPPTRRTNVIITEPRSKSAVVWERMVKNIEGKRKQMSRRTMNIKTPKSFDEIKKAMKVLEMPSKTYKNQVLAKGVKPANQLALLKTLNEETTKYVEVLESIKQLLASLNNLPKDKQNDLKDFVYNAAMNINLNSRVAKNLNKIETDRNIKGDVEIMTPKNKKSRMEYTLEKQPILSIDVPTSKKSLKLTRDEIINQLIKNRMEVYIRIKEEKKRDLSNDINYAIAKKILVCLEMGDYNLARELYKYIINQKEQTKDVSREYTTVSSTTKNFYGFPKEPLLQFEEPTRPNKWSMNSRDSWLKQLANLKKM